MRTDNGTDYNIVDVSCGDTILEIAFGDDTPWPLPAKDGIMLIDDRRYNVLSFNTEYIVRDNLRGCIVTINVLPI